MLKIKEMYSNIFKFMDGEILYAMRLYFFLYMTFFIAVFLITGLKGGLDVSVATLSELEQVVKYEVFIRDIVYLLIYLSLSFGIIFCSGNYGAVFCLAIHAFIMSVFLAASLVTEISTIKYLLIVILPQLILQLPALVLTCALAKNLKMEVSSEIDDDSKVKNLKNEIKDKEQTGISDNIKNTLIMELKIFILFIIPLILISSVMDAYGIIHLVKFFL